MNLRQRHTLLALALLAVLGLGCGLPSFLARAPQETPTPVKTLRPTFTLQPPATSTLTPTPTALPPTAVPPSDTPPPTSEPPTDTPLPSDTPPPLPSDTPEPTAEPPTATKAPPQPTKAPKPTNTPTAKPATAKHVVGAHGISGLVVARDKTTFAVGEKAFFTYEALNHTQNPVEFVLLGIKASNGQFNTSWINPDVIVPGTPFKHDDGLTFDSPGTYKVMLAICFARCGQPDADWEEFPQGAATITVK